MTDWQAFGMRLVQVDGDVVQAIWQGDVELAEVEQTFRAAFTMLLRGSMLVGKSHFPFDIVGTESESHAWINHRLMAPSHSQMEVASFSQLMVTQSGKHFPSFSGPRKDVLDVNGSLMDRLWDGLRNGGKPDATALL